MSYPIYYGDTVYIISGSGPISGGTDPFGGTNQGSCSPSDLSQFHIPPTCTGSTTSTCTNRVGTGPPDAFQILDTSGQIPTPNTPVQYLEQVTLFNQTWGSFWMGPVTSDGHCLLLSPPGTTASTLLRIHPTQTYSTQTIMAEVYPGSGATPPNIATAAAHPQADPFLDSWIYIPDSGSSRGAVVFNKTRSTPFTFVLATTPSPPPEPPTPLVPPAGGLIPLSPALGPGGLPIGPWAWPSIASLLTWQMWAALGSALLGFFTIAWGGVKRSKVGIMLGIVFLVLGIVFFGLWARGYWE